MIRLRIAAYLQVPFVNNKEMVLHLATPIFLLLLTLWPLWVMVFCTTPYRAFLSLTRYVLGSSLLTILDNWTPHLPIYFFGRPMDLIPMSIHSSLFVFFSILLKCPHNFILCALIYNVVQIWPGQTVTCLHTISPDHIWTTLYLTMSFPLINVSNLSFFLFSILLQFKLHCISFLIPVYNLNNRTNINLSYWSLSHDTSF
jgi:hypothetical protein